MESNNGTPVNGEYCQRCDMHFPNWDALMMHKIASGKHMACICCGREFVTVDGCRRHQRQDHAHEQNIRCAGCGQVFTRVGGYINHIETQQCKVIKKLDFERRRKEKADLKEALMAKADEDDFNGPLTFSDPPVRPSNWIAWDPEEESSNLDQSFQAFPTLSNNGNRQGGSRIRDLLTGDSPKKATELLTRESSDKSALQIKSENIAWSSGTNLFPNAPKAIQPSTQLLEAIANDTDGKKEQQYDTYDPDQPGFNLEAFFNPITEKYRCAHPGCNKTHKSAIALYQHLKSSAHKDEKLRCPGCLRLFGSATALVQHAEAQAVRCNIRESNEYRQAVDQITGGYVDTAGRHNDNTVRYRATDLTEGDPARTAILNREYWEKREADRERLIADASRNARW